MAVAVAVSIDLTLQDAIDQVVVNLKATAFEGYELSMSSSCSLHALMVNFDRLRFDF